MTQYNEKILNLESGETITRDYNSEEIAEIKIAQNEATERAQAEADRVAARQAILDRLGITAEEAAVLGL